MEPTELVLVSTLQDWGLCYVRLSTFHSYKELTRYVTLREVKESLQTHYRTVKSNLESKGLVIDRQDIFGPLLLPEQSTQEMRELLRLLVANLPTDHYPEPMVFFATLIRQDMAERVYHQKVRLIATAADAAEFSDEDCMKMTLLYGDTTQRNKVEQLYDVIKKDLGLTPRSERTLKGILCTLKTA